VLPNAVRVESPVTAATPLLLDSPHSGCFYPEDFGAAAPLANLRTAEDTDVDALLANAPNYGVTLVCANYPRAYIDCNRSVDDIDEALLDALWPTPVGASEKTKLGFGLVWRRLDDGSNIYARRLSIAEVTRRIDHVYRPYWRALEREAAHLHKRFGMLFHVNCHSMPSTATHASHLRRGTSHADIVIGDRDGSTSEPEFVELLANAFREQGYRVTRNDPYKGVEIVRMLGQPEFRKHSVQLEINRALYMNEATRDRSNDWARVKQDIDDVLSQVAAFTVERVAEQRVLK
jgi:N-formylglutamate deformylase